MAADLRKCCSEDDLPTAPWRFLLSFFPLPASVYYVTYNYSGMFSELRDYSLGQVAFAVFQALLAITQLLCHVNTLLTSTCNVNKRL